MDVALKQANLAKTLFQINDKQLLEKIELFVEDLIRKENKVNEPFVSYQSANLLELSKQPIPKKISAAQLIKEQNISINKFSIVLDNVDDSVFEDENIDELLTLI